MNTQSVWGRVDVIVPIHNALDLTKRCIASVLRTRRAEEHRLILVDDGSAAETAEYLRGVSQAKTNCDLIRSEHATGYTKAANRGLQASSAAMVVLLNSDTEVPPHWLEKLQKAMFETPGVGIVGPISNAASYQSIPWQQPNARERLSGQTVINGMPGGFNLETLNMWLEANIADTPLRVALVHGFCFAVRREVIEEIGLFDEESFPGGYGEEDDYCIRAVDAGWSLAIATKTHVWHQKSGSYRDADRRKRVSDARRQVELTHGAIRLVAIRRSLQESAIVISEKIRGALGA